MPTFRRNILSPSSVPIFPLSEWLPALSPLLFRSYKTPLLPYLVTSAPADGDSMFLRNVGINLQKHTAPNPKISATTYRKYVAPSDMRGPSMLSQDDATI
jgi:hypothetical protein